MMSGITHKSAEELQLLRKELTQNQPLCRSGGPKDSVPDGSEEQAEKLKEQLENYKECLSEQRILRKGNISVGKWCSGKNIAEVEINKGVHWQVFGKMIGGKLVLEPEEALYMADHGMLELYYGGLPMSIQQIYEMVLSEDFPLHHYIVYSYLRNFGFIVLRHKRRKQNDKTEEYKEEKVEGMTVDLEEEIKTKKDFEKHGAVIIGEEMKEVDMEEKNVKGIGKEMAEEKEKSSQAKTSDDVNMEENMDGKLKMGKIGIKDEETDKEKETPVSHYWQNKQCQPLLHPTDATSLENILDKLYIIKSYHDVSTKLPEMKSERFKITFDVFQPQKKFKKTDPGLPQHSLCICKFSDVPPSIGEINVLTCKSQPVPLKFAVVDGKDVSFYSFCDVQLPTYLETG